MNELNLIIKLRKLYENFFNKIGISVVKYIATCEQERLGKGLSPCLRDGERSSSAAQIHCIKSLRN